MKPIYILFLAVVLIFSFSYLVTAQQPTFNWSQPFTSKGNFRFAGVIDSQLVVIQCRARKEVVIRRFSPSLAVTTETVQTFASPETPPKKNRPAGSGGGGDRPGCATLNRRRFCQTRNERIRTVYVIFS